MNKEPNLTEREGWGEALYIGRPAEGIIKRRNMVGCGIVVVRAVSY